MQANPWLCSSNGRPFGRDPCDAVRGLAPVLSVVYELPVAVPIPHTPRMDASHWLQGSFHVPFPPCLEPGHVLIPSEWIGMVWGGPIGADRTGSGTYKTKKDLSWCM